VALQTERAVGILAAEPRKHSRAPRLENKLAEIFLIPGLHCGLSAPLRCGPIGLVV